MISEYNIAFDEFWSNSGFIWIDVRNANIMDAMTNVNTKRNSSEGTISIFGLVIQKQIVFIGGPLSLVLILLFMIAHIDNIKVTQELKSESFIPLYNDLLSKILTQLTVLVMPTLSSLTVLINFVLSQKVYSRNEITALVFICIGFLGTAFYSYKVYYRIIALRKMEEAV